MSAWAQDAGAPIFEITGIDYSQLPAIRVTAYGRDLGDDLALLPVTLFEDNVEQPILDSNVKAVGTQTALFLDLSDNVLDRHPDIAAAIERFPAAKLEVATDWLAAYAVDAEGGLRVITGFAAENEGQDAPEWAQDHQLVANSVRAFAPTAAPDITPLFGYISDVLDRFDTAPTPASVKRFLVVFSDGGDLLTAESLNTIATKAARLGVAIHTVMIGNPAATANANNLKRLADETNGLYWEYDEFSDESTLVDFWTFLGEQRVQQEYFYRLSKAAPQEVKLTVALAGNRQMSAVADFPVLPVQPPQLTILSPGADQVLNREAASFDTALNAIEPSTVPVVVDVSWLDGFPRTFRRFEYELGGIVTIQEEEPFNVLDFDVRDLDTGRYTLRVTAIDELGLEAKSAPLTLAINVVRPDPPTPTPTETPTPLPTATPEPTPTDAPTATATSQPVAVAGVSSGTITATGSITSGPATSAAAITLTVPAVTPVMAFKFPLPGIGDAGYGTLGGQRYVFLGARQIPVTPITIAIVVAPLLLIIGAIALLARRRKPAGDDYLAATEPAYDDAGYGDNASTVVDATAPYDMTEDATEPQVMINFVAPASLIYVEGGDQLPPKLDIEGGREVRIGRKQAYCDLIIDDARVSRLHASIVEKDDGKFYIKDEGSSGGTYVNRRKLRVNDLLELKHNDIVNFNMVSYRFEFNAKPEQPKP
jgi:hypothetical protein